MKRKKSISILALALIMASCFALGASASSGLQEISAYLNSNITVKMDGETQTFLDAKGNRVYPITYQGSTYLPVRAVAGLVGLDVNWDQTTQTVLLGKTRGVDLIDTYKAYHVDQDEPFQSAGQVQSAEGKTQDISGGTYSHWLYFGSDIGNVTGKTSISFNLGGKHDTLTFKYYASGDSTLKVLGDNGSVLGEYTIPGGQVAQTVTIPLFKTSELKFYVETGMHTWTNIFDAYLDAEG